GSGSGRPRMETQSEFFFCSGAATEVLKVGSSQLSGEEVLLLLIPGNPGVVGFYESFLLTLHGMLGRPVWAVSHAGHCAPPDSMDLVEGRSGSNGAAAARRDVFGLDGQIQHKLAFIRDRVPRGTRLVLVGHSIGCYMILEMMRRSPELEVLKAVLLFPTIERMAQSPQGKVMTPVLCQLRYLAYLPLFLLSLLPQLNSMYLGGQEMRMVQERDNVTIQKNLDRLIFYYGATDHWCPVSYFQDMRRDFPHGDIRLCERGVRHAFVLDAGQDVAQMVAAWIGGSLTA
uniref:Lipid droplet-associated hydrolase n=1 Tax=Xiphophorus couchianus TaxID=32473 RepID=A0A3B5KT09_9TELE